MNINQWDEQEEDPFRVLSKAEMDALRQAKPKSFSSISGWLVVGIQVVLTLIIAGFCYLFSKPVDRTVYTYSALVGGLIGFLPSALFLLRLEAAKKNVKSSPGGYLTAVVSGEFIKILATILLFIGFALKQPDLKWIPLLVTYLATLKCYLLAWFWK
ncbi:ATP synthase subunit I [Polynucleobacter sp. Latsch14-2]|jgi:ATP synthase protein I|uniref:ATP synthase subunit I n=1 Tax=Polynucleobacter sp. Latsch14-2 TaxID=2576920 RepID=UPI001C0CC420|nr:ATP synthase subunit I [Polynucleobacter sp. Latsch14-2]MBU3613989.1 ATP synthase subunit I [Polynucleobacter sp. Latsch14-2]